MKLTRVRNGKYQTGNGLTIQKMDGCWYIVSAWQVVLHKCPSLKDARAIAEYYQTDEAVSQAELLRERSI